MQNPAPHVALFPAPAMGHLIPFIELAKHLVHRHAFHATIVVPSLGPPPDAMKEALQNLPPTIAHVFLPPPSLQDLPQGTKPISRICISMIRSLPSLRDFLRSLQATTRLVSFVLNPLSTDAFRVGEEFNIPSYLFFPSGATGLSFLFYLQKLDGDEAIPEVVKMPGCVEIHKRDLLEHVQDPNDELYKLTLLMAKQISLGQGILVNTFDELEPGAIKALQKENSPVYVVGPLVRKHREDVYEEDVRQQQQKGRGKDERNDNRPDCMKWLDEQPRGSVLFVSFGSGGTLTHTQLGELALGLEMSGQRFLWVARAPNSETSAVAVFNIDSQKDPFDFLPKGFAERTKGRGLVVPSWAPQDEVLSHGSTGGFLSHCGWNSTLESVVNGVPLIAWPLYAEQKMNAVLLNEEVKVALRPRVNGDGVVEKEEVAEVVKELMEGEEGRRISERMKVLREAAMKVMRDEDGSHKLSELARQWQNHQV